MNRNTDEHTCNSPGRTINHRPDWAVPRRHYSSMRGCYVTEKETSYQSPERLMNRDSTSLSPPNIRELTEGTTKSTRHLPGYTGFINKSSLQVTAAEHSKAESPRHIDKNLLSANQLRRLPSYAGYSKPEDPRNDRGNIRPFCLKPEGETFC